MAAFSWTAADVKSSTGSAAIPDTGIVDAAVASPITQGQPVTKNAAGFVVLAANTSALLAGANGIFIAMNQAAAGQPISLLGVGATIDYGSIFGGATKPVCLGAAGVLEPYADLSTGDFFTIVGYTISATSMRFIGLASGLAVPA